MRAECEVFVDSVDFEDVVLTLPDAVFYHALHPEFAMTRFSPIPGGVEISTPWLTAELMGTGRWTKVVEVGALRLSAIAERTEFMPKVRLLFVGSMIYLNATGTTAYEVRQAPKMEKVGPGWQAMLPGMTPVTERERLRHAASQPMRPKRAQRSMIGTSLFGR